MSRSITDILKNDGIWYTLKRVFAYTIAHLPFGLGRSCTFSYLENTRLTFSPAQLTYAIFARRLTRHDDVSILQKFLKSGATAIDVGSNIGSLTIPAAQFVGPNGVVMAIEPSPKFATITRANVSVNNFNDRVTVHQVALGDCATSVHLDETLADDTTNHISDHGTPVSQVTLDSLTQTLPKIDFLKIDVEGYEGQVLHGASETLKKTIVIYIEFIPSLLARSGSSPEQILGILTRHFDLYTMSSAQNLIPFNFNNSVNLQVDLIGINRAHESNI